MALVLNHSAAKGTAKVILLGIANHDGDGGAWPSIATLARYANVDERNVRRAIVGLVRLGELRVDAQAGGLPETADHARTNRYHVLVRCPDGCDRGPGHRVTPTSPGGADIEGDRGAPAPGGDTGARGGEGGSAPRGVAPAPPEPSINRPWNTSTGSEDLDFESPPRKRENERHSAAPTTSQERRDHRLLAKFMSNYPAEAVNVVYGWMRTGAKDGVPICWPGRFAASRHGQSTGDPDVDEWQGYFVRWFLAGQENPVPPLARRDDGEDPWAA